MSEERRTTLILIAAAISTAACGVVTGQMKLCFMVLGLAVFAMYLVARLTTPKQDSILDASEFMAKEDWEDWERCLEDRACDIDDFLGDSEGFNKLPDGLDKPPPIVTPRAFPYHTFMPIPGMERVEARCYFDRDQVLVIVEDVDSIPGRSMRVCFSEFTQCPKSDPCKVSIERSATEGFTPEEQKRIVDQLTFWMKVGWLGERREKLVKQDEMRKKELEAHGLEDDYDPNGVIEGSLGRM